MTRYRLAAVAALSIVALLVTTTGGEAQRGNAAGESMYRAAMRCKTAQRTARDFVKATFELFRLVRGGGNREAGAARLVPVDGAKVITKLKDLTTSDGNDNVVDGKDTDKTNDDGVAKTKLEFDAFGNYRLKGKAKVDGDVVAVETIDFGVADRESGKCDPPLPGAG
jgi:hypothetical protein